MWNAIPRVLRTRLLTVGPALVVLALYLILPPALALAMQRLPHEIDGPPVRIIHTNVPTEELQADGVDAPAAACGDVTINEVLFNGADEWVELYVVNTLAAGTVLRVEDNDSGAVDFAAEFTLAQEIAAGLYIIVHGSDEAGSQEPAIGALNIFDAGDGSADLTNSNENIALSIAGTLCEEVYWESSAGSNSAAFGAPTTAVFTGSGSIGNGESIARNPNGPGGSFVAGTTAGLFNADGGQSIGRDNVDGTVPVTLGWFRSQSIDGTVYFAWQTATESSTAGFNLLAEHPEGLYKINEALIPSKVIDSVEPTDYSTTVVTDGTVFYLEEMSLEGKQEAHGPFQLGESYGAYITAGNKPTQDASGGLIHLPIILR